MDDCGPKIGLLVPAYNCQEQLSATISTLPCELPLRIIIVDDGSTSPLVPPPHDDRHHVSIVRSDKNLGIHGALRRGVEVLHAEGILYIARLDAGDFALPGRFLRQLRFLEDNPEVAVVGSAWEAVTQDGRTEYVCRPPTEDSEIRRLMLLRTCLAHPAVMFRVEAVVRAGNYRDAYPCAEDLDLFLRLLQSHRAANLAEVLTRKELSSKSVSVMRRRRMLLSTLRLQWSHLRVGYWTDWAGLAKSCAHFLLPRSTVVENLKSWLWFDNSGLWNK